MQTPNNHHNRTNPRNDQFGDVGRISELMGKFFKKSYFDFKSEPYSQHKEGEMAVKMQNEMKKYLNYANDTDWMFENNQGVSPIDNLPIN